MMDRNTESMIRTLIADAYMEAMGVAQHRQVTADDFKVLMRQILLGLFLSTNEVGMDNVAGEVRIADLERNLKEFVDAGMTAFDRELMNEENQGRASSALHLCPEKSLTNENDAGGIDERHNQGVTRE